jgi:hypothetical protein
MSLMTRHVTLGQVAWSVFILLLCGVASSAVKCFVKQEVWDERVEVDDYY